MFVVCEVNARSMGRLSGGGGRRNGTDCDCFGTSFGVRSLCNVDVNEAAKSGGCEALLGTQGLS